jgi:outer membrane protein assembly factor BamB
MRKSLQLLTCSSIILASTVLARSAEGDWRQWRGPTGDAKSPETGLLKEWPAGGPPLAWKTSGLGSGYSTLAVAGNQIFTMGDKGDDNYVIALDRQNGRKLWETKLGKAGAPGWGSYAGPRCMPVVDGNLLFAIAQYGEVVCLDTTTGRQIWRKHMINDFGGQLQEWGYSAMPLVDGDRVILAPGGSQGNLVALDKTTGELIWQSKELTDGIHYSSPVVAEIGGVYQYIQLTDASLAGIATDNGQLLWRAARKGAVAVVPTPVVYGDHVYVTSGYGVGCQLFKISAAGGEFTAEQVYANKTMVNHHGGVVLVDGHIYGFSDSRGWTCQNLKTGQAAWTDKRLNKGSVVYADGRLYLRAEDGRGTVALVEPTPEGYREKGRFDQPDRSDKNSWAHPIIAGGKLYLRDQDILLCYDLKASPQ